MPERAAPGWLRRAWGHVGDRGGRTLARVCAWPWAETAAAALLLGGWTLLTWGVATLTVWQVWPISAGLLALSLFGWRFFATIAREGLYALTRERER